MNPRTTGTLLLIAVALGVFVFYELDGEGGEVEEGVAPLFDVEAAEVTELRLQTTDDRAAVLQQEDGRWRLVAPVEFPADAFAAGRIADALAALSSQGAFEQPGPLAEYGLDEGSARRVGFSAGEQSHDLWLGRDAPMGGKRYVSFDGGVHAVTSFDVDALEKSLDDLRNRDIVDFDRRRVTRVEASWPGGRVVLDGKREGEDGEVVWRITSPTEAPGDQDVVDDLLSGIDYLRADGFVDDPAAASGLETPAFHLILSGAGEEAGEEDFEVTFAIGAELPDGSRLVRSDGPSLYTVDAERLEDFPREFFAYRDKQLARFSIADAEQVELYFQPHTGDPVSIVVSRQGSDWVSSPEAMDPDRALPMVSELSTLSASAILAESVGPDELSALELSPPNTIVTVLGRSGEGEASGQAPRLAELRLGRIDPAEGVVVQRVGDPILYRLPMDVGDTLPLSLEAFRNRFLAPEVPEELPGSPDYDALLPTAREESP